MFLCISTVILLLIKVIYDFDNKQFFWITDTGSLQMATDKMSISLQ